MTVFCQQLRRWISGGGDSEVDTRSESWRFEDRGAGTGTWELDRRDVIAGRFPRPRLPSSRGHGGSPSSSYLVRRRPA